MGNKNNLNNNSNLLANINSSLSNTIDLINLKPIFDINIDPYLQKISIIRDQNTALKKELQNSIAFTSSSVGEGLSFTTYKIISSLIFRCPL